MKQKGTQGETLQYQPLTRSTQESCPVLYSSTKLVSPPLCCEPNPSRTTLRVAIKAGESLCVSQEQAFPWNCATRNVGMSHGSRRSLPRSTIGSTCCSFRGLCSKRDLLRTIMVRAIRHQLSQPSDEQHLEEAHLKNKTELERAKGISAITSYSPLSPFS